METKEIEKFLKDLHINPKYIIFNFNEGSQYDLGDIIQRALNHFKPKPVISDSEIEKESILTKNTGWSLENQKIWKNGAKWMRSKLSTTVTEPKAIWEGYCGCSDEEICEICFEEKGWIINDGIAIKDK